MPFRTRFRAFRSPRETHPDRFAFLFYLRTRVRFSFQRLCSPLRPTPPRTKPRTCRFRLLGWIQRSPSKSRRRRSDGSRVRTLLNSSRFRGRILHCRKKIAGRHVGADAQAHLKPACPRSLRIQVLYVWIPSDTERTRTCHGRGARDGEPIVVPSGKEQPVLQTAGSPLHASDAVLQIGQEQGFEAFPSVWTRTPVSSLEPWERKKPKKVAQGRSPHPFPIDPGSTRISPSILSLPSPGSQKKKQKKNQPCTPPEKDWWEIEGIGSQEGSLSLSPSPEGPVAAPSPPLPSHRPREGGGVPLPTHQLRRRATCTGRSHASSAIEGEDLRDEGASTRSKEKGDVGQPFDGTDRTAAGRSSDRVSRKAERVGLDRGLCNPLSSFRSSLCISSHLPLARMLRRASRGKGGTETCARTMVDGKGVF